MTMYCTCIAVVLSSKAAILTLRGMTNWGGHFGKCDKPFWEADSCSAGAEIPHILQHPKVHFAVR